MNIQKYQALKVQLEELQREADRAQGTLEQLQRDLEAQFECKTIKQAQRLLERLEAEQQEAEREFDQALADFESVYGEQLK